MGTIRTGANGGFSGKAGSVVGSSWKNVNYIKGLPKKSSKPATLPQLTQQAKFALVVRTLQPITNLLNVGFKSGNTKASGYNLALQYLINNAVIGDYPEFKIDFSKMMISKGSVAVPIGPQAAVEAGQLTVSWSPILSKYGAFPTDEITVLIYNPVKNLYIPAEGAMRESGQLQVELPTDFAGDTIHVYAFFTTLDGLKMSNSVYAGAVEVAIA